MKRSDLIGGYKVLAKCKYPKDKVALAMCCVKIGAFIEAHEKEQQALVEKLGCGRVDEFQGVFQRLQIQGSKVTEEEFLEASEFSKNVDKAVKELLNEVVEVEYPKLELEELLDKNDLVGEESAMLCKLFKE